MASTLDAVPSGIYYSVDSDNFYGMNNHKGQGTEFFARWHDRWNEFPIGRGILPTSFEVWKDNETPSSTLSYAALEKQRDELLNCLLTMRAWASIHTDDLLDEKAMRKLRRDVATADKAIANAQCNP